MSESQSQTRWLLIGKDKYRVIVRRSGRAKNYILHVDLDGSIELVVPRRAAMAAALNFVNERQQWLIKALDRNEKIRDRIPAQRRLISGTPLPYFGSNYYLSVVANDRRRRTIVTERGEELIVKANSKTDIRQKIIMWYKQRSRDFFTAQAISMANRTGVRVQQIKVVDTKTQWGSCNHTKKVLTFHWRLALAPLNIARYVVAHEVAHLLLADHSPDFWEQVATLDSGFKQHRKWLRQYGHSLVL